MCLKIVTRYGLLCCFLVALPLFAYAQFQERENRGFGGDQGVVGGKAMVIQFGKGGFEGAFQGGFGGKKGAFGKRKSMDPDQIFNFIAKDKEYINISEVQMGREMMEEFAKKNGITNGKLTRGDFAKYMEEQQSRTRQFRGDQGGQGASEDMDERRKQFADKMLQWMDKNKDGKISTDEIPDNFRDRVKDVDKNGDGTITPDEMQQMMRGRGRGGDDDSNDRRRDSRNPVITNVIEEMDPTSRPVVYRAGNLPDNLPSWFSKLDIDFDGQVGLYEWVKAQKKVDEFASNDTNGDGFITAEELMRVLGIAIPESSSGTAVAGNFGQPFTFGGGGRRGSGGFGPGGNGQGFGGGFGPGGNGKGFGGGKGPGFGGNGMGQFGPGGEGGGFRGMGRGGRGGDNGNFGGRGGRGGRRGGGGNGGMFGGGRGGDNGNFGGRGGRGQFGGGSDDD